MNFDNYRLVLESIDSNPGKFNQEYWHFSSTCSSTHCFGGWAQILSGKAEDHKTARRDARIFLGLTYAEANYVFSASRSLNELREFKGLAVYDMSGRDIDGYDRLGLDKAGYDRSGRDIDGYDMSGLDLAGYDKEGFDLDGLNRKLEIKK